MNKTRKLTAVLGITAAVSVCALGAAFASGSELEATTLPAIQEEGVSQDAENLKYLGVRNYGTLTRMENGQFLLTSSDPDAVNPEMVLNITNETLILDAVNGFPVQAGDLKEGEAVYVYTANFMTMSLPPITNAMVIICQLPQDAAAPEFQVIRDAEMASNQTSVTITTTEGDTFIVDQESGLLPYLTRNIVFLDDLTPGKAVLVWKTTEGLKEVGPGVAEARASKVVLFQEQYSTGE
ncbi:MAG TPA: hypothetical protein IAC92_10450 [Candidatus Ventrisoma faecale]|nr:hypothetical protein [Candidatus Ventrisoma faecale]